MAVIIKSKGEIAVMRQAGRIVATVLEMLKLQLKPGMKTAELDAIAAREVARLKATPSFKGYHGYPANLCVSIDDEIVHGIPGERVVKEGDVVSLDFGVIFRGFQGDAAITVGVGSVSPDAQRLIAACEGALNAGIAAARPGVKLGAISAAVQSYAEFRGYSVVREYTGHGIGRQMHEEPLVPNFGRPEEGLELKEGMTLAIEPMLNIGDWRTKVGGDRWTVSTLDGSLSAHFEHTIAVTDGEAEVLTVL